MNDAMGAFFSKLRDGLKKTREKLSEQVRFILHSDAALTPELIEELEEILIQADIGVETVQSLIENLRESIKRDKVRTTDEVYTLLKSDLENELNIENKTIENSGVAPWIILVVGVNGTGKTTTIGKLANHYRMADKKVLIAAADTYRAAAVEQLEIWSNRAGVDIIRSAAKADPGAVVFDALKAAEARGVDVVIIDTAGRLHTKINLMEELKKINRIIKKSCPDAPHEVLLVLDANTGQNGIIQAKEFFHAVPITGIVLTKLDGTAKGGIVVSITHQLKIPVRYVGLGEDISDLQSFNAHEFVDALFE